MKIAEEGDIYIRLLTIRDTENIIKWRNSPFVMNNFIWREPLTEEIHEDWIRTKINEGKVVQFIIGHGQTEVGSVYFRNIDDKCISAEYGIFLDQSHTGKGIGYTATMLAVRYMFEEFGLKYISLRVLESNKNAIKLYEKCGFKLEEKTELVNINGEDQKVLFMVMYQ